MFNEKEREQIAIEVAYKFKQYLKWHTDFSYIETSMAWPLVYSHMKVGDLFG